MSALAAAGPRRSWAEFSRDPADVAAFREGVRVMKSREPSDPTSWFFQGAIHGATAALIAEAQRKDPKVTQQLADAYWNKCPHHGEGSANFIIWHRAYIHHFEEILRAASGDPTLRLPYWDYSVNPPLPEQFRMPASETTNPLYHAKRKDEINDGRGLSARAVDARPALAETTFFGVTDSDGFAGGDFDSSSRTMSLLEGLPHGQVHMAIGRNGTGMATVREAAFDPIFWLHHANIDRLWARWDCQPGVTWGRPPTAAWLAETPWTFFGPDGRPTPRWSRLDYIRSVRPGDYDDPQTTCARPLSQTDPPGLSPAIILAQLGDGAAVLGEAGPVSTRRAGADGVSVELDLGPGLAGLREMLRGDDPSQLFISLDGLVAEALPEDGATMGYDVHVNAAGGATPTRDAPSYVGTVTLFGVEEALHEDHGGEPQTGQLFDVTEALRAGAVDGSVTVTLVPFDLLEPLDGEELVVEDGGIAFENVRLLATPE